MIFWGGAYYSEFLSLKYSQERLQNAGKMHKISTNELKQVLATYALICMQNGSHGLWEASGMPPRY